MKKRIQKLISLLLVLMMAVSMMACGNGASKDKNDDSDGEVREITFPLEEEVSFDIMVMDDRDMNEELAKTDWWQELYEATNVKINFIHLPNDTTQANANLNALFTSKKEGDAILGPIVSDSDLMTMASKGLVISLDQYIDNEKLMPNLHERIFAENPNSRKLLITSDGKSYSLLKYDAIEGNYLENPIWINKAWVEQLGMEIPQTIEDLEKILKAFRDNDMNGNGDKTDEIPYIMMSGHGYAHPEALLALWGLPTKDSQFDSYVYVEEGKVKFAPTSDAYKTALTTLNKWFEDDLIWSEAFVATSDTFNAKLSGELPVVGMLTSKTPPATNSEDYVQIEPPSVKGYETRWYIHPGIMGTKGVFEVTRSCENVDILMHWIDLFYTFDNSLMTRYGYEEDGRYVVNADGKVEVQTLKPDVIENLEETVPTLYDLINRFPMAFTAEDYAERIALSGDSATYQENYALYKKYITDEGWPRPYIALEDANKAAELRTDIFNTITQKRAAWITGSGDINAEWDAYLESMDKMGVKEFTEIYQRAYDAFNNK